MIAASSTEFRRDGPESQEIDASGVASQATRRSHAHTEGAQDGLTGLSDSEVVQRRVEFGENRLPSERPLSRTKILLDQIRSPLVYIILAAAVISLLMGEFGDFGIIMAVVVADVVLGFFQEYRAQRTYVALKGLLEPTTTVIRDGSRREIAVWELVPGDLVVLTAGEKVPGDGELIEATRLAVDEAILTGESEPVTKHASPETPSPPPGPGQPSSEDVRAWQVFMGTTVVTGRGITRITATGTRTELGQIAASLSEHAEEDTPLQVRLKAFSRVLTYVVVGFTLVILAVGLLVGREFWDMSRTAIILAVAAVPEGLLIAVTVILVLGMRRILRRNGLVKKLLAVETLGSVTVICTDKTGTLTEGRMRVHRADLLDQARAWQTMVLCNDLEGPVDIALWEYAEKNMPSSPQELFDGTERLAEELFTSETKYMIAAVTSRLLKGDEYYFLKGAPEIVLGMCAEPAKGRADVPTVAHEQILAEADEWANQGLRLLGLAYREGGAMEDHSGYTWVGLLGMEDPVRAGVAEAVEIAEHAGIRVIMVTGDYRPTAESVARSVGLSLNGASLDGDQIASMSDQDLQTRVRDVSVFARIRPKDKLRIVSALQSDDQIAAMIGDGVNDAPALARSDIGVVVGSATDVAKENADLILLDNDFSTVVAAVEEGRVIFENIRKVVAYTLSNSFAEVLAIFGAMMLGWPAPLTVAQILWIHLICDGPADIVLGFEPEEDGVMDEKPRSLKDPILTRLAGALVAAISISSALFALFLFGHFHLAHGNPAEGQSIVFASFAVNSMVYIFAYRSMRQPLWRMKPPTANKPLIWAVSAGMLTAVLPFIVPGLGELLGIVPLTAEEWTWVGGFALFLLAVVEFAKGLSRRFP